MCRGHAKEESTWKSFEVESRCDRQAQAHTSGRISAEKEPLKKKSKIFHFFPTKTRFQTNTVRWRQIKSFNLQKIFELMFYWKTAWNFELLFQIISLLWRAFSLVLGKCGFRTELWNVRMGLWGASAHGMHVITAHKKKYIFKNIC